jgi:hypothetical protein
LSPIIHADGVSQGGHGQLAAPCQGVHEPQPGVIGEHFEQHGQVACLSIAE